MEFKKIPDEEYFAIEALSNSGDKRLLKTAAHYKTPVEKTGPMIFGSLTHCLTTEPNELWNRFAIKPSCTKNSKEGKIKWPKWYEENKGKQPISKSDIELAEKCKQSLLGYEFNGIDFKTLLDVSEIEIAAFWNYTFNGIITPCKCKYDLINHKYKIIVDLKTDVDASPDKFRNTVYDKRSGLWMQSFFYRMVPELHDYKFVFLVVEKKEPFAVGMYSVDESLRQEAMYLFEEAAEIYNHGNRTGIWSNQYNNQPEELKVPGWFNFKQR